MFLVAMNQTEAHLYRFYFKFCRIIIEKKEKTGILYFDHSSNATPIIR